MTLIIFQMGVFHSAPGAEVLKVKGKSVLIKDENGELEANKEYDLLNEDQTVAGKIKVIKVNKKTKRSIGKILKGKAKKKMQVEVLENFDFAGSSSGSISAGASEWALRAYGGLVTGTDYQSSPFLFGGDITGYVNDKMRWLIGGHYWFVNEEFFNFSMMEANVGAAYIVPIRPNLVVELGARFGFSMATLTLNLGGQEVSEDDSTLTLSPQATVLFDLSPQFKLLAEVRKPFFFKDLNIEAIYLLGGLSYNFN
jgi:hypothetical protein